MKGLWPPAVSFGVQLVMPHNLKQSTLKLPWDCAPDDVLLCKGYVDEPM